MADIAADGEVVGVTEHPAGVPEIGGMMFCGGVMIAGTGADFRAPETTSRTDFALQMREYGVGAGRRGVKVLGGVDLNSFCGTWKVMYELK